MNNQPMDRTQQICCLRSLVEAAKRYPAGNLHRQKALTKAIRLLVPLLWNERSPVYNDALQQTLEYFCRHVDDYNPELGSVVTWLNVHLRWRLIDLSRPGRELPFSQFEPYDDGTSPFVDIPDPINRTAITILEEVQAWAATDASGALKTIHMKKYPHVTAQFLILQRLPPAEVSWQCLSTILGVKVSSLSAFYERHCMAQLRQFGKAQGYFEEA